MTFHALDIETSSKDLKHPEYALQPWRPEFSVDLVGTYGLTKYYDYRNSQLCEIPGTLYNKHVWCWNTVFDIAGLMSQGVDCSKIKWLDAMSAAKWVLRSQKTDPPDKSKKRYSFSLANVAKDYLKDWEHYNEFLDVKAHYVAAGEDPEYWRRRCELDVEATLRLGVLFWTQMTPQQRKSFLIEQEALYPTAKAWLEGCHYDFEEADTLREKLEREQTKLLEELQFNWQLRETTVQLATTIASPQKLAALVYDTWGVPFDEDHGYTEKGKEMIDKGFITQRGKKIPWSEEAILKFRSVGKEALTFLIENHGEQYPQLRLIKDYRKILTDINKFVAGPEKAREYLGSGAMRHNSRLNSTYTGRCTVSSKVRYG